MISESYYWKSELLKYSSLIKKSQCSKRRWTSAQYGNLEKNVMIGFYIIRKLIESYKLTNKIVSTNICGIKYQLKKAGIHHFNNHRLDEFYDLENPLDASFSLDFLINQFIHSFIFRPIIEIKDGKLKREYVFTALLFTSDSKKKYLYQIDINEVVNLFKMLGNCNVTSIQWEYAPKKNHLTITTSDKVQEIPEGILKLIQEEEENDVKV